ncbi:hypothetical protein [Caenispirillum salinarum]|uniref:hypothetical protein n=1 Tax=Caenispirillum salinarum TaxID=859058 RepID=UPI003850E148
MPLQNRVTPEGEIIRHSARGMFMGNRGILHDDHQRLGRARWRTKSWVTCALSFNGIKRQLMAPGRYTELFFLDEAVALCAGHRPCARCRRADALQFRSLWTERVDPAVRGLKALDDSLHGQRVERYEHRQVRHVADLDSLPDGAFIALQGRQEPMLVLGDMLLPYAISSYDPPEPRPSGMTVEVLTPRGTVGVLAAGYRPRLHSSAEGMTSEAVCTPG